MKCLVCGKKIRKAEPWQFMYLDRDSNPVYVCSKKCMRRYEDGEG